MKKEVIAVPLLPFTDDEETALADKLTALDSVALSHYVESARLALGNKALDASWRPRIQVGLDRAEAVLLSQSLMTPVVAEEPPPVVVKASRAKKVEA